jgi:hypothetical protein
MKYAAHTPVAAPWTLSDLTKHEFDALGDVLRHFRVAPSMCRRLEELKLVEHRFDKWALTDAGHDKLDFEL